MARKMTAADQLVERLIEWGIDVCFGLPGDGINGVMESLRTHSDRIRFVHVRHEETAALAACAYGKFTGKPAACLSTAAPGAVHLLNGLYDALIDQAPVVAITGMTYHDVIGTHYLQDINHDAVMRDACVYSQRIMGEAHVLPVVDMAVRAAIGHRGPAAIAMPIDIQSGDAVTGDRSIKNIEGHSAVAAVDGARIPPRDRLRHAAEILSSAERPLIFIGAGARGAGEQVEQVAERLEAPIVTAMLGKDAVPDDHPHCLGGYALVGTRPAQNALQSCDAILIVGSSSPYIEFLPAPGSAAGVQIDDRPERIGMRYPVQVGLCGDAKLTLSELLPLLETRTDRSFLERAQAEMKDWRALQAERAEPREGAPIPPDAIPHHLARSLSDRAILTGDSGTVTTWAARTELRRGQMFSFSGTMCSMMAALPYAIGAQVAFPDRQVVALTGDGSLTMQMGELATLAQHDLPVKVVVMRNDVLGLIKWEQMAFLGNPQYGVQLSPVEFSRVAEACGIRGVKIEDPRRVGDQLEQALRIDGPALIEAVVDPHEMPMTPIVNPEHAKGVAWGLARGEPNRERIALTMSRTLAREMRYETSPAGALVKEGAKPAAAAAGALAAGGAAALALRGRKGKR
ncbi:MAG TPA: thiamine pyrophosphate-dependent enzyme [Solirubrobacteraceae bacterium]|nr:thiamine pyrophosphate-dependent enzyme [Solirubrobacteraceae bacterium]